MTVQLSGNCSRCGGPADVAYTSRDAMSPLELCEKHHAEHGEAVRKGSWKLVEA